MKRLDLIIQTLIISSIFVLLPQGINKAGWYWNILFVQLVLGPWQYISSLISVLSKAPFWILKGLHLILSSIYLSTLFVIEFISGEFWPVIYLIFIPWLLAIYYYILTWKWVLSKKTRQSKFLPHTSF